MIEIVNKIIIVAFSWLFILLYQRCTVTQTSNCTIIWVFICIFIFWNKIYTESKPWNRQLMSGVVRNNTGIHWPFRNFPQSYFQSPICCWLLFIVQIPGHRDNRLFSVSNNLHFITRDVSQFGNFISTLLICHVHVRPHTRISWYGCDPEINNSKLRTGSTEYSDSNIHEVLTDQHTSVAYTSSHGDNEMSECLICLSFHR